MAGTHETGEYGDLAIMGDASRLLTVYTASTEGSECTKQLHTQCAVLRGCVPRNRVNVMDAPVRDLTRKARSHEVRDPARSAGSHEKCGFVRVCGLIVRRG